MINASNHTFNVPLRRNRETRAIRENLNVTKESLSHAYFGSIVILYFSKIIQTCFDPSRLPARSKGHIVNPGGT